MGAEEILKIVGAILILVAVISVVFIVVNMGQNTMKGATDGVVDTLSDVQDKYKHLDGMVLSGTSLQRCYLDYKDEVSWKVTVGTNEAAGKDAHNWFVGELKGATDNGWEYTPNGKYILSISGEVVSKSATDKLKSDRGKIIIEVIQDVN